MEKNTATIGSELDTILGERTAQLIQKTAQPGTQKIKNDMDMIYLLVLLARTQVDIKAPSPSPHKKLTYTSVDHTGSVTRRTDLLVEPAASSGEAVQPVGLVVYLPSDLGISAKESLSAAIGRRYAQQGYVFMVPGDFVNIPQLRLDGDSARRQGRYSAMRVVDMLQAVRSLDSSYVKLPVRLVGAGWGANVAVATFEDLVQQQTGANIELVAAAGFYALDDEFGRIDSASEVAATDESSVPYTDADIERVLGEAAD